MAGFSLAANAAGGAQGVSEYGADVMFAPFLFCRRIGVFAPYREKDGAA